MGVGPFPVTEASKSSEFGVVCIAREGGVVRLDGRWSPTGEVFNRKR